MTGTAPHSSWYTTFSSELSAQGTADHERQRILKDTRAEADAAGLAPAAMYGPATLYARELACALRSAAPARTARAMTSAECARPPGEVVLRLSGLHARRGRRPVLHGVDLEVRRGEVVAVVGANGAGKSTLMQVCAGLVAPSGGRVERTGHFGYAPQLEALAPLLTVDEHLRLVGAARGISPSRATATGHRLLSLLGWRAKGSHTVEALSGGTRQKLNLSLAQLDSPDLLLLDEPYQGFDALAHEELWELIESWRPSAGILIVTHLLHEIDRVDRVVELPAPEEAAR
ncbi:ATP-binding cassette domain-containing protein [Actinomyces capricornis]|uniref:ABC transporter domain-containing protein n=1 Tax=Actinomyces capricornis TaxID=2755559 RepID=A0ABN6K3J9_9ACTO|nr:hypothetical protein MANAM107_10180 [Actinomyces capricornis]